MRPDLFLVAPVNAPFSYPCISDSSRVSGRAAQLTAMNGPFLRGDRLWIALAISSFPVPVGPSIRTGLSLSAISGRKERISLILSCLPTISLLVKERFTCVLSSSISERSLKVSTPPMMFPSSFHRMAVLMLMGFLSPFLVIILQRRLTPDFPQDRVSSRARFYAVGRFS